MTWIMNCYEKMVNIDNWDVLDCTTISDQETGLCVAFKIYLYRGGGEMMTLGYIDNKEGECYEIFERLIRGVPGSIRTLESILYYYLKEEFDKKYKGMTYGETFSEEHDRRHAEIEKLIGTRFIEDQD